MHNAEKLHYLNEKADEISQIQQESLAADYDVALKEYNEKDKPKVVKFNNEYFPVAKEMPFKFATFYFRHCVRKVQGKTQMEVPEDRMYEFIELMFGEKFLSSLERSEAGINFVFQHIVPDIMGMWGHDVDTGQGGKAQISGNGGAKNGMTPGY
ncbi:hypothetical protein JCM19037_1417 [Geomicrobium sp. JCM 19037]|uniref:hypothetical protein n=1 Tax=Geomicrobium sp. JCM 19037 TaxID=1460634 RepID=UPI00045F2881|nr:hypothetical protein [Geomicrobium sp. JCM 19037]GAK03124.1 hypothetical protein JCM19037_1417 [Geomicrobium sp. JCM 19037]